MRHGGFNLRKRIDGQSISFLRDWLSSHEIVIDAFAKSVGD